MSKLPDSYRLLLRSIFIFGTMWFRVFCLLSFCLLSPVIRGQIQLIEENKDGDIIISIANEAPCDLVVHLSGEVENFKSSEGLPIRLIVPANSTVKATTLKRINPLKQAQYRMRYTSKPGNPETARHYSRQVYRLPYREGEDYLVSQGPDGPYSHQGKTAYDFTLPKRTKICAVRDGVVVQVKEDSRKGCGHPKCKPHGNFLLIMHDDGSFANYGHLKKRGALVDVGDRVEAGEVIAKSGDTGWATAPHLHLEFVLPGYDEPRPVNANEIFFEVNGIKKRLTVGQSY